MGKPRTFLAGRPGAGSNSDANKLAITGPAVAGSCAEVGSSHMMNGLRSNLVRATAIRCRSPELKLLPFCPR